MDGTSKIMMKPIMKFYKYLYYRIYIWQLRLYGKAWGPEISALGGIVILINCNVLTLAVIVDIFSGIDFIEKYINFLHAHHITKGKEIIIGMCFFYLIERIIKRNNGVQKVIKEFKRETSRQKLKGTIFIWCYIFGSVIASIFLSIFAGYVKREL